MALDGLLGKIDAVELAALIVDGRFGRIEVFAHVVFLLQYASSKGHHLAEVVVDREDDASKESVAQLAVVGA